MFKRLKRAKANIKDFVSSAVWRSPLTYSGEHINPRTALQLTTVYRCVDIIASSVKDMPLRVHRLRGGAWEVDEQHRYNYLFNVRANNLVSASDLWRDLLIDKLLNGDSYLFLRRRGGYTNRVDNLELLPNYRTTPSVDENTGEKYYQFSNNRSELVRIRIEDVCQFTSPGYDGLTSLSPIEAVARETIGIGLASQRWAGNFLSSGARFSYSLVSDKTLSPKQCAEIQELIQQQSKTGSGVLVLTGGFKPVPMSISPRDAEILATRKFTVEEICRVFGVPLHMVGAMEKTTSWASGISEQNRAFLQFTLSGHLVQIEQELSYKLWPGRSDIKVMFDRSALLQSDQQSRFNAYRLALGRAGEPGFMSVDEVRKKENLPAMKDVNKGEHSAFNA